MSDEPVKITDDESFDKAIELVAEGPVNIISGYKSHFHVTDTDKAIDIIGQLLNAGQLVSVERDPPAHLKSGMTLAHHNILPREYECPGCHHKTKEFDTLFTKSDEKGVEWATCQECGWHGSMLAI